MKGFEKFLFFYSIIAVTALGIGSLFFSPRPENFIGLIGLLPVIAYFWLRLTSPSEVSSSKWSLRLVLVIFVLSTLGVYGFSLFRRMDEELKLKKEALIQTQTLARLEDLKAELQVLSQKSSSGEAIASDVARIKEELTALKEKDTLNSNLLGAYETLEDIPIGKITIASSKVTQLNVYQDKNSTSKVLWKIDYGENYQYFQKEGSWYLIEIPDGNKGWVSASDVKEVTTNQTP
jgi:hypothetical protein